MRIQLEMSDRQVAELKALMRVTDLDTYKELFNNALTLLGWAVEEVQSGNVIASMDEATGKYKVLVMHPLKKAVDGARTTAEEMGTLAER